jgi:ammonia channel protein AmtB
MIPGVGFFYSGLLRRKNALSMIWLSMMCVAVVSFQVSFFFSFTPALVSQRSSSGSFGGVYTTTDKNGVYLDSTFCLQIFAGV